MVRAAEIDQINGISSEVDFDSESPIDLVNSEWLHRQDLRLDAGFYNTETMRAHRAMAESGLTLRRLGEVTQRIFIPPRFKRVYVDAAYGVPFLQGTHIPQFRPTNLKYLSRSAHKNLDRWIIKAGWVLVTCSGTIGRVGIALQQWNNWAASQHIMRIVPHSDGVCPAGYIYAWLSSPLGQAQFNGIYGAVVDELTASHAADILIPVPVTDEQRQIVASIDERVMASVASKEMALKMDSVAVGEIGSLIS